MTGDFVWVAIHESLEKALENLSPLLLGLEEREEIVLERDSLIL